MKDTKKLSIFNSIIFKLNLVVAFALLLTYPVPFINPSSFWLSAIWGLTYPFLLLVNCGFLVYWLLKRRWQILLSLITILLGWNLLTKTIAFHIVENKSEIVETAKEGTEETPEKDATDVKIMTYNVQNFDLYNWTENVESRNKMIELIQSEQPDIINFQEFYTDDNDDSQFHNVKLLVNELGYKHYSFEKTLTLRTTNHWGLATFSKFPIVNKDRITFPETQNNIVAYSDINIKGDTIRLFNLHLQSIHLGRQDLKYLKQLGLGEKDGKQEEKTDHWKSFTSIVSKLKAAYVKRGNQARTLADHIQESPHRVIVCGDFNDTPTSYTYQTISKNLQDAFLKTGLGLGGTYAGPLPSFRIDYMLLDPSFEARSTEVIRKKYSDHYPMTCEFRIWK
ncbi:MAG: endonuclease/exonuclease/phosphatase family protein [Chitinophagales bacterium]